MMVIMLMMTLKIGPLSDGLGSGLDDGQVIHASRPQHVCVCSTCLRVAEVLALLNLASCRPRELLENRRPRFGPGNAVTGQQQKM